MTTEMTTGIGTADATTVTVRGLDLATDLVGKRSFTEMVHFLTVGTFPAPAEMAVLDACLVVLMEHGLNTSTLVARMTYDSVPDQLQVAMAAGLAVVGDVFVGTMEGTARILADGLRAEDQDTYFRDVVAKFQADGKRVPGFGHATHRPDDPRTQPLLAVAAAHNICAGEVALLQKLAVVVDESYGKHLTINATGAIGALLLGLGYTPEIMRGIAVVSRAGGLLGHLLEDKSTGLSRTVVANTRRDTRYVGE